ncbi:hypothetical protein BDW74DRAFT_155100 [Aspergillus multicolor]|uniref:DUF4238 domain-containing protein n=1 Tax=Aspergillus multicolor TaxID=41759 RepID=UPI003CCDAFC7
MSARPQNHHFIPQFVLRQFAPEEQPPAAPAASPAKRGRRRDFIVNKVDLNKGVLAQRPVSTEFALVDMYRDPGFDENPYHLEKKLSKLETQASEALRKARAAFGKGHTLELKRTEVNTLRKFLFLMKYRGTAMFERYNRDKIDDYDSDDWLRMRTYMETKGFTKPRDVWFNNLRHILELDMNGGKEWMKTLGSRIYPDDALMFELHVNWTFMSFCCPSDAEGEFVLTQNAYAIFEGPSSENLDLVTGKRNAIVYTQYHNFAPVTPKLMIVLRSHLLKHSRGGEEDSFPETLRRSLEAALRAQHLHPDQAGSILQDLPIRPCEVAYKDRNSNPPSFHKDDIFQFRVFRLSTAHVTTINNLFLEEAYAVPSIVYHSPAALRASLKHYLESEVPTMKRFLDHPSDLRRSYLHKLENVLRDLGGTARPRINPFDIGQARFRIHMALHVGDVIGKQLLDKGGIPVLPEGYKLLKPDATLETFWNDIDQASRFFMLRAKMDSALSLTNFSRSEKIAVREQLMVFLSDFPAERIWLYLKIARNRDKFDESDFYIQTKPLCLTGVEDVYARDIERYPAVRRYLTREMLFDGAT